MCWSGLQRQLVWGCAFITIIYHQVQLSEAQCPRHLGKRLTDTLARSIPSKAVGALADTSPRRSLLQSTDCSLNLGGSIHKYTACQAYGSDQGNTEAIDYHLYWSVVDLGNGSSTLDAAINALHNGWAGFGIPDSSGGMLGGSALITKTCSTCSSGASIDDYFLGGYTPSAVKPPSRLTILSRSATGNATNLQATFRLLVAASGADLKAFNIIFALGPLGSDGGLQQHPLSQGNTQTIDLTPGLVTTLPEPLAAAPLTATPAPAPTVAAAPAQGAAASRSPASGAKAASAEAATVTAPASPPQGAASGCTLAFNNENLSFQQCQALDPLPGGARLLWTVEPDPSSTGSILNGALDVQTTGWHGFGFPQTPDVMVGGKVLIVKACATCPSGASVAPYSLKDYSSQAVEQDANALSVVTSSAAKTTDGRLQATFSLKMTQSIEQLSTPLPFISAVGPLSTEERCQEHAASAKVSGSINFGTGVSNVEVTSDNKPKIHGWLMVVSWGFLIPVGVLIARYMRSVDPWWFHLHRAIQLTAFLVGIAGLGVGIKMGKKTGTDVELAHRCIGFIVNGLGLLQVLAIIVRPAKEAGYRRYWNWYHWWVGRAAVALAITNVYLGLKTVDERTGLFVAYSMVIGVVLLTAAVLEVVIKWRPWSKRLGSDEGSVQGSEHPKGQFIASSEAKANGAL
ncbi:hypothetical protein WJX72_012106 [[Myrmecia] bisecta]|uniref:Cytochrome b561 domain-containing protein n=1 Tax=[Myrmecia] bisecta TaxID=41462 RepID=A0AAW1Q6H2_9CHLO